MLTFCPGQLNQSKDTNQKLKKTGNQSFLSELGNQLSLHTSFVDLEEPKTVKEALTTPEWYQAMKDNFQSLVKNKA